MAFIWLGFIDGVDAALVAIAGIVSDRLRSVAAVISSSSMMTSSSFGALDRLVALDEAMEPYALSSRVRL